jgi:LysM repeat protein
MKILKVFGIVVGIHVFALILIFANPGCSAMTKSTPAPGDTVIKSDAPSPNITVPTISASDSPTTFDPNASTGSVSAGIRYSPTRPGTSAAGALEAEPVSDVTPASTYTVAKGDSLSVVAHKNHLTKAELAAANNLKSEATLRVGQKLIIPGKAATGYVAAAPGSKSAAAVGKTAAVDTATAQKGPADTVKHVVKAGETLGAIARKYQVKVGEIATANNISDPAKIRPGMELIIPGWQSPAGKPAKSGAKNVARAVKEPPKATTIPTISVGAEDQPIATGASSSSDAPPVIPVEDAPPPPKKP